jgi:hypothetical protein
MVICPENRWCGKAGSESDIDEIMDALEESRAAARYAIP